MEKEDTGKLPFRSLLVAEFLSTFALVFAGTGAIIANDFSGGAVSHTGIAIVFGLIVMAMIYTVGEVSGAHMNPAVTLAFFISGRFPAKNIAPYLLSQFAGAILASFVYRTIFPDHPHLGSTLPVVGVWATLVLELILTFFLMMVILHTATGSREQGMMAGIAIGGTVGLEAMFAGPWTGASMNPARSLGPALVSGQLEHLWIYFVAPVVGAALAVLVHSWIMGERMGFQKSKSSL